MADNTNKATEPKVDGKAFDDFFDSIGNKAQQVQGNKDEAEEEDQKVVDEIESLCMNCHANVCSCAPLPIYS